MGSFHKALTNSLGFAVAKETSNWPAAPVNLAFETEHQGVRWRHATAYYIVGHETC